MSDFKLTNLAVNMHFPGNVAQLDDAGMPSLMVWIPAFKLSDVLNTTDDSIHPAFIVNGSQIPGFWYSKYENVVHNGKAYSLPGEDPKVKADFDSACACCEEKGYGWHMSTAVEWAAVALWSRKNGTLPYGNNNYGKDTRETEYKAIQTAQDTSGNVIRVATGTGPLTWSHDRTMSGVWDMNGNVWEWQAGIRVVWGELQIFANNDAADPDNPQNKASACWKAINAADGSLVDPECTANGEAVLSGSTVRVDYASGAWTYSTTISTSTGTASCTFATIRTDDTISDAAKVMLRALAMLPDEGAEASSYENDNAMMRNDMAECVIFRGGSRDNSTGAGLFYICGVFPRDTLSDVIGFRSAYIPNI